MSSRTQLGVFVLPALLLVIVLGPPLWLDFAAPETDAVVTRKYEGYKLYRDPDAGWRRRLYVWTRFRTPSGATHTGELMLSDPAYDSLSVGSHLRVRYIPVYPYITRTVGRTTLIQARELFTPETTRGRWFALLLIFAPIIFVAGRIARVAAAIVAVVWLGATWVYLLRPVPLPTPGPTHASARVSWTQVETRGVTGRRYDRLATPYREIALTFVPPGSRDSITVVDAVDSASIVPKPVNGTLEPIGYEPGAPRTARLLAGTRTFINANRYDYLILALAPIALGFLSGGVRLKRRTRVARSALAHPRSELP
jgi:hypothetical protein